MKLSNFIYILIVMLCSCHQVRQNKTIFGGISCIRDTSSVLLSELFTDSCKIIPLETKDESLIGSVNKIVKCKGHYYVLSNDKWIFHFDDLGNYVSSLRKLGEGPDEYTYIGDFDVYDINGTVEIWIVDYNKIKIYNAENLSFLRTIEFSSVVNKFERIGPDELFVMNGQNEKSLAIVNEKGQIQSEFLNRSVPLLLFRSISFIPYYDSYLFQLGISNDVVVYNKNQRSFELTSYFDADNGLISKEELESLYDKYGQSYISYFNKYKRVGSFINKQNCCWLSIYDINKGYITKISSNTDSFSAQLYPDCHIVNDLFSVDDFSFLGTMNFAKTSDSVLMFLELSKLKDVNEIQLKNGKIFPVNEEMNPFLIEFFL